MSRAIGLVALLAALALALGPRAPARAECAVSWYIPTLVTDTTRAMPQDFALVLLAVPDFRHDTYRAGPFAGGFALTRRGQRVPLVVEELGLGIARLRPERPPGPGLWRVEGLPTPSSVNVAYGAVLPPAPLTPEGVSISMPRVRGQAATSDTPREVVAFFEPATQRSPLLLGYWNGSLSAVARVRPEDARVTLFRPMRCASFHPGVVPPPAGAARELSWLDGYGRESPRFAVP